MIIGVIVAIVVIVGIAVAGTIEYNTRRRRAAFGPEYEALVEQEGGARAADRELTRRRRAVSDLNLRPLRGEEKSRWAEDWRQVQESFVDDPSAALSQADAMILRLAQSRGYPSGDREDVAALLSVPHTAAISGYREAVRVREASEQDPAAVSTEDKRVAIRGYGALFADMLDASVTDEDARPKVALEERR